jgi:hypothetical protein
MAYTNPEMRGATGIAAVVRGITPDFISKKGISGVVSAPCKNDRPENEREGKTYLICTLFHLARLHYSPVKLLW